MRILLGLPTAGSPTQPFLDSLAALQLPPGCVDFDRVLVSGNFIPAQRELIIEEALERHVDFLAMIDDDIVVPPDALTLLFAALEDDPQTALAGGLYYSRDGLRPMAVAEWNGEDTTSALVPAFDDRSAVEVDGVAFGCTLLRTSALAALQRPFLSAHIVIDRAQRLVRVADEDYLFCERLRRAGWRVRLHGGVRCKHYDRKTRKLIPDVWEDAGVTARPRMYVRTAQGEALIEPDRSLPRNRERHRPVTLEYLLVE